MDLSLDSGKREANAMPEKIGHYRFVAAVFRDVGDLAATLVELRAQNFAPGRLLVLATNLGDMRTRLTRLGLGEMPIAPVHSASQSVSPSEGEPRLDSGLRKLLNEVQSVPEEGEAGLVNGKETSQIYAQLRQDADDGGNVLVASVANPEEQLAGARILLRQRCECVLTHEIAAHDA